MNTFLHLFQRAIGAPARSCDQLNPYAKCAETEAPLDVDVRTEAREENAQTGGMFMSPYRML
jgi:hypothetical protein